MSGEHSSNSDSGRDRSEVAGHDSDATARGPSISGRDLDEVRLELGLSKEQLARAAGCSRALIDQFISGRKPLSLDWIERMPPAVWSRMLRRSLERAEPKVSERLSVLPPEQHVSVSVIAIGEATATVCEVMADGIVTAQERPKMARAWARVELAARHAGRDASRGGR